MRLYVYLISFILQYYTSVSIQPYFPPQIVFSTDDGYTIAIDEINQQAYQTLNYSLEEQQTSFVMKHFPYSIHDTPQSKYYVQLSLDYSASFDCQYATYWTFSGRNFNQFPIHWWINQTSFEIKNYIDFNYKMIHSTNSSLDVDYWYANQLCETESKQIFPCEEIYFQKNTQIPLRYTEVVRHGMQVIQQITNYKLISMGKPDQKYFDSIPKNWSIICQDANLGILYYPLAVTIDLNQSSEIHISLSAPPHRINGNDTVTIQWKETLCKNCFEWSPKQLHFNGKNFHQKQILTITRIKNGPLAQLFPIFHGGAFDSIPTDEYPIIIT